MSRHGLEQKEKESRNELWKLTTWLATPSCLCFRWTRQGERRFIRGCTEIESAPWNEMQARGERKRCVEKLSERVYRIVIRWNSETTSDRTRSRQWLDWVRRGLISAIWELSRDQEPRRAEGSHQRELSLLAIPFRGIVVANEFSNRQKRARGLSMTC